MIMCCSRNTIRKNPESAIAYFLPMEDPRILFSDAMMSWLYRSANVILNGYLSMSKCIKWPHLYQFWLKQELGVLAATIRLPHHSHELPLATEIENIFPLIWQTPMDSYLRNQRETTIRQP